MLPRVIYGLIIVMGIALLYLGYRLSDRPEITSSSPPPSTTTEITTSSQPTGTPHPSSLPALKEREARGFDFTVGRVIEETSTYRRHFVTYRSNTLRISGIMNVPKGDGPFPVLILNHGYIDPAVYTNGRGLKREQNYLASRGYIVLHPDYRNHAESDKTADSEIGFRSGYTEDVINAIDALKKAQLPYVNSSRIGMLGHSMGGGIALNVMVTKPDLIHAVVLFAPISSDMRDNYARWIENSPERKEAVAAQFGLPHDNPQIWNSLSAKTYLDTITMPVLVHHGTNDESVPISWSESLASDLKVANKEVTLYTYAGEAHEFGPAWNQVMERTITFFNQHIKKNS